MKTTEIKHIFELRDRIRLTGELSKFISLTYGLKEPDPEFIIYLANVLKKYYDFLTFEQIESAFEKNALGFLPVETKVKFTISDIRSVLDVYVKYKNLKEQKNNKLEWSLGKRADIRRQWCDNLVKIFEDYAENGKRAMITLPTYTCGVLAKIGLLNASGIDKKETFHNSPINAGGYKKNLKNEALIWATFDKLLSNCESLEKHIDKYRYEYSENEIPI
jgi:hypothetical protein